MLKLENDLVFVKDELPINIKQSVQSQMREFHGLYAFKIEEAFSQASAVSH